MPFPNMTEDEYAQKVWEDEQRRLEAEKGRLGNQRMGDFMGALSQNESPMPKPFSGEEYAAPPVHHGETLPSQAPLKMQSMQQPAVPPSAMAKVDQVLAQDSSTPKLPDEVPPPGPGGSSIQDNIKSYLAQKEAQRFRRGLGGGMLKAAKGMSGIAGFNVNVDGSQPTVAEQNLEDRISAEERDWFRQNTNIEIPENMSRSRLMEMLPNMFKGMQSKQTTDMAVQKQEDWKQQNVNTARRLTAAKFRSDTAKARTGIESLVSARKQLASENSIAQASVIIKAARASGEVGPLTESDKAPFQARMGAIRQLEDWFSRHSTGYLTPELKNELSNLMDIWESSIRDSTIALEDVYTKAHWQELGYKDENEMRNTLLNTQTMLGYPGTSNNPLPDQGAQSYELSPEDALQSGWQPTQDPNVWVDPNGDEYQITG